jgi:hypothetical protein
MVEYEYEGEGLYENIQQYKGQLLNLDRYLDKITHI